jgi:hypothetical protein
VAAGQGAAGSAESACSCQRRAARRSDLVSLRSKPVLGAGSWSGPTRGAGSRFATESRPSPGLRRDEALRGGHHPDIGRHELDSHLPVVHTAAGYPGTPPGNAGLRLAPAVGRAARRVGSVGVAGRSGETKGWMSMAEDETPGDPAPLAADRPVVDGTTATSAELRAEVAALNDERRAHVAQLRSDVGDSLAALTSRLDLSARWREQRVRALDAVRARLDARTVALMAAAALGLVVLGRRRR